MIFLDLNLEPHDGYTVHDMLREHETFQQAKIVGVTASNLPEDMVKMQASGFDGFIGKPLSHENFEDQLQRILTGEYLWEVE